MAALLDLRFAVTWNPAHWSSPGAGDGRIAEPAIWNVALTDAEVGALAAGVSPLLIRPESLVAYWPLWGRYSPEIDLVGGAGLTVTGATVADHPRVHYPARQRRVYVPAAAVSGSGMLLGSKLLLSKLRGRLVG